MYSSGSQRDLTPRGVPCNLISYNVYMLQVHHVAWYPPTISYFCLRSLWSDGGIRTDSSRRSRFECWRQLQQRRRRCRRRRRRGGRGSRVITTIVEELVDYILQCIMKTFNAEQQWLRNWLRKVYQWDTLRRWVQYHLLARQVGIRFDGITGWIPPPRVTSLAFESSD